MSDLAVCFECFNGLQLGVPFRGGRADAGFGVMDFINLAHGVQYMLGAYLSVAFYYHGQLLRRRGAGAAGLAARRAGAGGVGVRHLSAIIWRTVGAYVWVQSLSLNEGVEDRVGRGAAEHADFRAAVGTRCRSWMDCAIPSIHHRLGGGGGSWV